MHLKSNEKIFHTDAQEKSDHWSSTSQLACTPKLTRTFRLSIALSVGENRRLIAVSVLELLKMQPAAFYFEMDSRDSQV